MPPSLNGGVPSRNFQNRALNKAVLSDGRTSAAERNSNDNDVIWDDPPPVASRQRNSAGAELVNASGPRSS